MKATKPTAPPKKAAPDDALPKYAAAKDLQTIDDPFFDDHDFFGQPQDAGPAGRSPLVGGGLGGLPGKGPPISRSGSLPVGPGSSVHPSTGAAGPGETAISERFRADRIAYGKSMMAAREAENAERASRRRLNVLIGAALLGIAVIVLLTLAAFVFTGSPENDGNVTLTLTLSTEDANQTEDIDDIEEDRRFLLKRQMTVQGYEYDNYDVIAPNRTANAAVQWKDEAESAVTNLETKQTIPVPVTSGIVNGQRVHTIRRRPEKRGASSVWEKSQKKFTSTLVAKQSNLPTTLKDGHKRAG